jgi:CBS-domain-containing membrane protein
MSQQTRGQRVQVFCGETDQVDRLPRYEAILEFLRREGAAGATVVRGIAGFGANSRIHLANALRLSADLPVVVTWVDDPRRVARLLPRLRELAGSGIVTVEDVEIASYGRRRLEQLRFDLPVEDVMTRDVVVATAGESVRTAVERLVASGLRAMPVVDSDRRLIGMLSSSDLVARAGLGARIKLLATLPGRSRGALLDRLPARPVEEVMTREPVAARTTDTLAEATHLMASHRIKRLPVVDADSRLVGIVARIDVLGAVGETFPRELSPVGKGKAPRTVREVMRVEAPTVAANADLASLLDVVVSTRLHRAVVIDAERRVLGVVSDAEVLGSVEPSRAAGVLTALMQAAQPSVASDRTAAELVSGPALTAGPEMTIAEAAQRMLESRHKILCIVDDERRLIGIVDRADLLRAAGEALATPAPEPGERTAG